jgi:tetratricopeptide (TPR) repeat protein
MSSEALYEQYKDALKRGHVASLRGRVDEALLAYAEAARIAPERSTPHASAGNALLRRKRPAEALRHYEVALAMAPRDEPALLGRAQALAALDRRGDAADAFDALADAQAGSGRLADAVDAARRGLEMAEGRERRRTLERLIARLRATEPDEPGRMALEHALLVLDGPAVPRPKATHKSPAAGSHPHGAPSGTGHAEASTAAAAGAGAAAPSADAAAEGSAAAATATPADGDIAATLARQDEIASRPESERMSAETRAADAAAEAPAELETVAVGRAPRVIPAGVTVIDLMARAEAADAAGVPERALEAMLDLAALHARDGRVEAALDACYAALSLDPDSVALHLALAELYTRRGWDALANEKLELLERLARLDGDDGVVAEIAGLRAGRA